MEEENEARVKPGNEGRRNVVIPRTTMVQRVQRGVGAQRGLQLVIHSLRNLRKVGGQ